MLLLTLRVSWRFNRIRHHTEECVKVVFGLLFDSYRRIIILINGLRCRLRSVSGRLILGFPAPHFLRLPACHIDCLEEVDKDSCGDDEDESQAALVDFLVREACESDGHAEIGKGHGFIEQGDFVFNVFFHGPARDDEQLDEGGLDEQADDLEEWVVSQDHEDLDDRRPPEEGDDGPVLAADSVDSETLSQRLVLCDKLFITEIVSILSNDVK